MDEEELDQSDDNYSDFAEALEGFEGFIKDQMGDAEWRLNNLYPFQADNGEVRIFTMRDLQRKMYRDRWYRNVVLKARQLGSSTFWSLFILDSLLFDQNPLRCGIIAQTRLAAKGILKKCRFAFENMDSDLKAGLGITMKATAELLTFSNGATIESGITFRSGTCDILLVSELGKMAAKMPEKAKEVVTGAFPSVRDGGVLIVESTGEGTDGYLFDMVSQAQEIQRNPHRHLGQKDFHLHFFPWHDSPRYQTDEPFELTEEDKAYFARLRLRGYLFTKEQKWWWARERSTFKQDMYREFPTFEDEAFMAVGNALILAKAMVAAEENGQVGEVPFDPNLPVITSWDLGATSACWFFQYYDGGRIAFIDYMEAEHADLKQWHTALTERANKRGYHYAAHVFPWDGENKVGMTATTKFFAEEAGFENVYCNQRHNFQMQVKIAHMMMPRCFFAENETLLGRQRILSYRRVHNVSTGVFEERPLKTLPSHGSEAFITGLLFDPSDLAMPADMGHKGNGPSNPPPGAKKKRTFLGGLLGNKDEAPEKRGEAVLRSADGVSVISKGWLRRLTS